MRGKRPHMTHVSQSAMDEELLKAGNPPRADGSSQRRLLRSGIVDPLVE